MTKNIRALMVAAAMAATIAIPASVYAQAQSPLVVQLQPQGGSGVSGTATLTDMGGGRTQVVVRVSTGGNPTMPGHIHDGSCPNVGAVRFPLNTVMNGTSTSEVNTTIADLLRGTFAINLHKSPQEASVYTSCGNVVAGATVLPRTGSAASTIPALPALAAAGALFAGLAGFALRRRFR